MNHYEKRLSNFERDMGGDSTEEDDMRAKQSERLRRAKLLSGYYSLQIQAINKESENSIKTNPLLQNKRNSQGLKIGLFNTEKDLMVQDLISLRAEALFEKYNRATGNQKRRKTCDEMGSVYEEIQDKVIFSLSLGE